MARQPSPKKDSAHARNTAFGLPSRSLGEGWCHRLSATLHESKPVAQELADNFILVLADVNHRNGRSRNDALNEKYGNPVQFGLPVLLVLDENGRLLITQETGALEDGDKAHDPTKVLAFLRAWAPKK